MSVLSDDFTSPPLGAVVPPAPLDHAPLRKLLEFIGTLSTEDKQEILSALAVQAVAEANAPFSVTDEEGFVRGYLVPLSAVAADPQDASLQDELRSALEYVLADALRKDAETFSRRRSIDFARTFRMGWYDRKGVAS